MILGNPTLQTVLEFIEDEGCTSCGEIPTGMVVLGPDAIVPQPCGHVHDAKDWLDARWAE